MIISVFRLRQTTDTNDSLYLHVVIKRRLHRVLLFKGMLLSAFSESVHMYCEKQCFIFVFRYVNMLDMYV